MITYRRLLLVALTALGLLATSGATTAGAHPASATPATSVQRATVTTGDCELQGVTCRPSRTGSCQNYTSQTTPPDFVKVLVRTGTSTTQIQTMQFLQYVTNVVPNEWPSTWKTDALRAGAVAAKMYAWYWITHFGGYVNDDPTQCFDVTDDADFQVYKAATATTPVIQATIDTWPVVVQRSGQVVQVLHKSYLHDTKETCGAYATGSTLSAYGSQACVTANTGNKYNVILHTYLSGVQLINGDQRRVQDDFRFLHESTRVAYRGGYWTLDDGYKTTFHYGIAGDIPAVTDDAEGFAHIGVYRPSTGTWWIAGPTGRTTSQTVYGGRTDIPVAAHWDGLSKPSVIAIYRPSDGTWHFRGHTSVQWGQPGDIPVPADYNGDGTTDVAVYRPSTGQWLVQGRPAVQYGGQTDVPAPADYDGNGSADIALYRPSNHTYHVLGGTSVSYGEKGDIPVVGDYTGDGRADFVMYRPSTARWYMKGYPSQSFGSINSTPVGAAPNRS